ncbi:MAG: helix-turn-helix domain-containing protein [Prevotella sp.]|nr:helix-turn-helix domain-containing protein [Prevotella sp.]
MSDGELAGLIGVSRQTINAIVNGHSDPALSRLHAIADALNVRVRNLFME